MTKIKPNTLNWEPIRQILQLLPYEIKDVYVEAQQAVFTVLPPKWQKDETVTHIVLEAFKPLTDIELSAGRRQLYRGIAGNDDYIGIEFNLYLKHLYRFVKTGSSDVDQQ